MDILCRRNGYKWFTPKKLDISMQYYTFVLNNEPRDICVIVTSFGQYNTTTNQWASSNLPILRKKSWKTTYVISKNAKSASRISEHSIAQLSNAFPLVSNEQLHHQPAQIQMKSTGNRLAQVLAHTRRSKAMEEKD